MASTPEKATHHSSCFVSSQFVPFRRQAAFADVSPANAAAKVAVQAWSGVSSPERRDDQSIKKADMASLIRPQPSINASTKEMDNEEKVVVVVGKSSRFKRVCVFCGSSSGKRDCYKDAAIELGQELVAKRLDLVYGGGSIGLMGLVSQAVHTGGGHVLGIIPRALMGKEKTGETIGEVKAVTDMHQRKAEMARHSDCFIALPGGYGTLEELLEVITWAQLGIHDKPVGLLNVDGYYNYLLTFIDKAVDDGFIKPSQRHIFVSAPNAKELVQKLEEYVPVNDGVRDKVKWEVVVEEEQQQQQQQVGVGYNPPMQTEIAL